MAYSATNWKDYPDLSTAITAARLNNIEAGIVAAYVQGTGTLVNADIASGAAIVYAKLNLALSILNADISASAAIAVSKLADPGANKVIGSSGGAAAAITPPGTELDYAQITAAPAAVTATTEGTSVAQITGNSVVYDGTRVRVELAWPKATVAGGFCTPTFVFYRDSTVMGQASLGLWTAGATPGGTLECFDTPAAGAHTYKVAMFVSGNNITINAGAGGSGATLPAYLRVVKA